MNSLAGFTGAVLLAVFALGMVWESVDRFLHPVAIRFGRAILVAVLGLVVNAGSAVVLGHQHEEGGVHDAGHDAEHGHAGAHADHHDHSHHHHHDHNLRSTHLHVIADALTSVLAAFALLAAKYFGATWVDPAMGIVGAALVARWFLSLISTTARVLLDHQAPADVLEQVRSLITDGDKAHVADLHVWTIGPGRYAAATVVAGSQPRTAQEYRTRLREAGLGIAHVTVETNQTYEEPAQRDRATEA